MNRFQKMSCMMALSGGLMALATTYVSAIEISDIAIRSEAAVIADNAATDHWPNLENDLKNALIEELADISSETGLIMQVTVRALSVAERAKATEDDGSLSTTIMFISDGQAAGALEHTVSVNQKGEGGISVDRIIIPRTSDEFYTALVSHYAQTVAEKVRDYN